MIAFLFSRPGQYLIGALAILAVIGGIYMKGRIDGGARVQAKWDAAVQAAIERGEGARRDAERDCAGGLCDDKFNRD